MAKIQIDIPYDLNKKLKVYSINNDFNNRKLAVIDILKKKLIN